MSYIFKHRASVQELEFYSGPYALSGQLDLPKEGKLPYPVALIVPDSPRHTRDGFASGFPAFRDYYSKIADAILATGTAVFRYDKGGAGRSSSGLNDKIDVIAAYKSMVDRPEIDPALVNIVAQGGGSAFIFRNIRDLMKFNPLHSLLLLSTSVNYLKLEKTTCHIMVIAGEGEGKKSPTSLQKYSDTLGVKTEFYEAIGADSRFCTDTETRSWYQEGGCTFHQSVLEKITDWFNQIK